MAHHIDYEHDPPLECVTDLVRILRERKISAELKLAQKHAHTILGYVFYLWPPRGEPQEHLPTPITGDPMDDDQWADVMRELAAAVNTEAVKVGISSTAVAGSEAPIFFWIKILRILFDLLT